MHICSYVADRLTIGEEDEQGAAMSMSSKGRRIVTLAGSHCYEFLISCAGEVHTNILHRASEKAHVRLSRFHREWLL